MKPLAPERVRQLANQTNLISLEFMVCPGVIANPVVRY